MIKVDASDTFFEYIQKYVDLDADTTDLIARRISEAVLPDKHIILQEGRKCDKVHFIVSGLARSYYTDFAGKTTTWSFHFNNEVCLRLIAQRS